MPEFNVIKPAPPHHKGIVGATAGGYFRLLHIDAACKSGASRLAHRLNNCPDLYGFLEVIEALRHDPPLRGFHQQLRIVVLVGKKRIKRQADVFAFLLDLPRADLDDLLFQTFSHFHCHLSCCAEDAYFGDVPTTPNHGQVIPRASTRR